MVQIRQLTPATSACFITMIVVKGSRGAGIRLVRWGSGLIVLSALLERVVTGSRADRINLPGQSLLPTCFCLNSMRRGILRLFCVAQSIIIRGWGLRRCAVCVQIEDASRVYRDVGGEEFLILSLPNQSGKAVPTAVSRVHVSRIEKDPALRAIYFLKSFAPRQFGSAFYLNHWDSRRRSHWLITAEDLTPHSIDSEHVSGDQALVRCKKCGAVFDSSVCRIKNVDGSLLVFCPAGCSLGHVSLRGMVNRVE